MAWCRIGGNPLSEPVLVSCSLDPKGQVSVKFEGKFNKLHSRKLTWKHRLEMATILFRPATYHISCSYSVRHTVSTGALPPRVERRLFACNTNIMMLGHGNAFRITDPLWGKSIVHLCTWPAIPVFEICCCCKLEQNNDQTVELPVILDTMRMGQNIRRFFFYQFMT